MVELLQISNLTGLCKSHALDYKFLADFITHDFIRILKLLKIQKVAKDGCACPTLTRQALNYGNIFTRF